VSPDDDELAGGGEGIGGTMASNGPQGGAHRGWAVARPDGLPEEEHNRPPRPRGTPGVAAQDRRRRARRRRRIMRRVRRVSGVVLLVVVALAAWIGVRGWLAKDHLEDAAAMVPRLEQQARAGHPSPTDLNKLQQQASDARRLTGDAIWSGAMKLPFVGDDLAAVRASAVAVGTVAQDAVPPLLRVAGTLDPAVLRPRDGRIQLEPLVQAQSPLRAADAALTRARSVMAPFVGDGDQSGSLLRPVGDAVTRLGQQLDRVASDTATGSRAADLLPPMLGADGPRSYLVLFQNLAEARSLGGIAGAYAVVQADEGRLRITKQGAGADIPKFNEPLVDLGARARELYQSKPTRYFLNVTQPIDFAESGRIARAMWADRTGADVDGVLSVDPVALSYMLRASGPITLPDGTQLTSDNAVDLLMSDIYFRITDPVAQNEFFTKATLAVFQQLLSGTGDAGEMVAALAQAGGEHRLLAWSAHAAEQKRLAGTVLEGRLPRTEPHRPTIGVFFNEGTSSKLSYYLRAAADVTGGRCRDDGLRELQLDLTLSSTAPTDGLSEYIAGSVHPYVMEPVVYLAAPLRGGLVDVSVDGTARPVNSQLVDGRMVAATTLRIPPGRDVHLRAHYVVPVTTHDAALRTTPGVSPFAASVRIASCPWL
jgi:hypothetical protein